MFENINETIEIIIQAIRNSKIINAILACIFLLIILRVYSKLMQGLFKKIIKQTEDVDMTRQITTIFQVVHHVIGGVIAAIFITTYLEKIGVDIRPILTAAGVLGVAVGFGSKRLVEDIITGALILLEGQIRVGDFVEINGKMGEVEKFNLKLIKLRSITGEVYFIRNGMVDIISNYSRNYSYAIIDVPISYDSNTDRVEEVLHEIYNEMIANEQYNKIIIGSLEILGIEEFQDSSIAIRIRVKTKPMQHFEFKRKFNILLKKKFDEYGIEIPFPQRVVYIKKD